MRKWVDDGYVSHFWIYTKSIYAVGIFIKCIKETTGYRKSGGGLHLRVIVDYSDDFSVEIARKSI
jgi:hypothetical protein